MVAGCPGNFEVITGEGPLPMAIFELLEYIVNEVTSDATRHHCVVPLCNDVLAVLHWREGACCKHIAGSSHYFNRSIHVRLGYSCF